MFVHLSQGGGEVFFCMKPKFITGVARRGHLGLCLNAISRLTLKGHLFTVHLFCFFCVIYVRKDS